MATTRKSAKPRRMSKAAARVQAEAEQFAEAFGRLEVGRVVVAPGVRRDVVAQQGGAVHVVLDNTVPGGFRMEPV